MKKRNILLVLFFIIGLLCPVGAQEKKEILSNVFTLELSFGDKDVPDEYLLARPILLAVNDAGEIYVFDEYKVKVFDKSGKPKTIFGGRGQGPDEFEGRVSRLFISPEGWLCVSERNSWSVFSPANKFISKNVFSSSVVFNTLKNDYKISTSEGGAGQNIFVLNDKELIVKGTTGTFDNYNEAGEYYNYIFYAHENIVSAITKYRDVGAFMYKSGSGQGVILTSILGSLSFEILPGSKIIYTHTYHDVKHTNNTAQLTFHVVSPTKNTKNEFVITYKPEAIPDSVIKSFNPSYREKLYKIVLSIEEKKMYNNIENALKKMKYDRPFTNMQSDGIYLFLRCSSSDNKKSLIRVINAETGKEVSNFIQPSNFYLDTIKNGYAYLSTTPKDGYPIVEKYRIDPRVYGK